MKKIEILKLWKKTIQQHDKEVIRVRSTYELDPASKLMWAMEGISHSYTTMAALAVGDKNGWLEWFACDCDMGKISRKIVLRDRSMFEVKTLQHLLYVIEQDKDES
jgi:hypothetical protein